MVSVVISLVFAFRSAARSRAALHLEILALRHQVAVLNRSRAPRLRLTAADRVLWAWLSQPWIGWRPAVVLVKPDTVLAWHRRGFRLFWTWKSRYRTGRPAAAPEVRALIRRMAAANPLLGCAANSWGTAEAGDLGESGDRREVHAATRQATITAVANVPRQPCRQIMAADFFVVPTVTYRLLFVLVILAHDRRRIVHVAVTEHPTAAWTAQQLRNAFPEDHAPRYLLHDRDAVFTDVASTIGAMQIHELATAPRSPWQNAYVERLIGSIRRECLDHVIVLSVAGLQRVLADYVEYYMNTRTHLSLGKDAPVPRPATPLTSGRIVAIPQVNGLHHRYDRAAA